MNASFLNLEIKLLIAQYGRQRVLREFATVTEESLADLESEISRFDRGVARARRASSKGNANPILAACEARPDARDLLERLGNAYVNRVFLGELRQVHEFLRRHGIPVRQKSRAVALNRVMKVLSTLDRKDLDDLVGHIEERATGSEFSILANELMATERR